MQLRVECNWGYGRSDMMRVRAHVATCKAWCTAKATSPKEAHERCGVGMCHTMHRLY